MKKFLFGIALLILGILGILFGQADDSPGAGGIGLLIAVFAVYLIFNSLTKSKNKSKK